LMMIPERFGIAMTNNDWELRDDLTEQERKYVLIELVNRDILYQVERNELTEKDIFEIEKRKLSKYFNL
ncbi:MAG: hypothetical protein ACOZAL_01015, partial [Patescibacteria group bacterium]